MSNELEAIARALVANGKGILAADESTGTIEKRFNDIDIPNTLENRQAYRELLFTTPELENYISGVILYDETLRQSTTAGVPFVKILQKAGVLPGIKVDLGAEDLVNRPGEKMTKGLDGLRDRLAEYRQLGATFAKWRAVIAIGEGIPSRTCVKTNATQLALYAALCQEAGIVPIVEPEVLMDADNTLERCAEVTGFTLHQVFARLIDYGVKLEGIVLKPNMVIAGKKCERQAAAEDVAHATLKTLYRHVPAAVPGIVFLSGGQSELQSTTHLNLMNKQGSHPWKLSYSYGRALQASALRAWRGKPEQVTAGQSAFLRRARNNSAAATGTYDSSMEH